MPRSCCLCVCLLVSLVAAGVRAEDPKPADAGIIRDGDRIALVGATFVERLANHGYFETALTSAFPDRRFTVRNLGWSGDNVFGRARARFGGESDGFQHLKLTLDVVKPTLIIVAYGNNEAYEGEAGLKKFSDGLDKMLSMLQATGARIVLLGTIRREPLGAPLPDPAAYNKMLETYDSLLRDTASKKGFLFIDLADLVPSGQSPGQAPPTGADRLTDNGLHFSAYGDWRVGPQLAMKLGAKPNVWKYSASKENLDPRGTGVKKFKGTSSNDGQHILGISFHFMDEALPLPTAPRYSPTGASQFISRTLTVEDLSPGEYELSIDDKPIAKYSSDKLAKGITLTSGPEFDQAEALRQTINAKNELFFHRYRPQNETYLFLFRKHEQGNNAVEIPQFDPLIEAKEKEIAELARPKPHTYKLTRIK